MDELAPHEAFAKLADETRVEILTEVAAAERDRDPSADYPVLSFSELYERVDVSNTSRFAYHLEQLTGVFLRKTEDGYSFTYAGDRVVRTILSDAYSESVAFEPVAVDGVCPACRTERLEARAEDRRFRVRCGDCERGSVTYTLTPGLVSGREPAEIVDAVAARIRTEISQVLERVCGECGGRLSDEIRESDVLSDRNSIYVGRCEECWSTFTLPLPFWVLDHPAVAAFYWEREVDIRRRPFWQLTGRVLDGRWSSRRTGEEPPTYRVSLSEGGDELRLDLDAGLAVTNVTRVTSTRGDLG